MTAGQEQFREITEFGVIPAPSGAGALLLHPEEGNCCLVLRVHHWPAETGGRFRLRRAPSPQPDPGTWALVTFEVCLQSVFGYPNDEARRGDPRTGGAQPGYGFYEVTGSSWPARLTAYNQHAFPDRTPEHYARMKHYFIGCHDASAEFLALDMNVEILDAPYSDVLNRAIHHATGQATR